MMFFFLEHLAKPVSSWLFKTLPKAGASLEGFASFTELVLYLKIPQA